MARSQRDCDCVANVATCCSRADQSRPRDFSAGGARPTVGASSGSVRKAWLSVIAGIQDSGLRDWHPPVRSSYFGPGTPYRIHSRWTAPSCAFSQRLLGPASSSARAAVHASKDVNEILKEGGRSGSAGVRARRWTGALMVDELTSQWGSRRRRLHDAQLRDALQLDLGLDTRSC